MLLPIASALLRSSQTANPIFPKAVELISLDFLTHFTMTEALLCKAMTIWLMTVQRRESSLWCGTGWPDLPLIINPFLPFHFMSTSPSYLASVSCRTISDLMVKPQFGGLNICHEVYVRSFHDSISRISGEDEREIVVAFHTIITFPNWMSKYLPLTFKPLMSISNSQIPSEHNTSSKVLTFLTLDFSLVQY